MFEKVETPPFAIIPGYLLSTLLKACRIPCLTKSLIMLWTGAFAAAASLMEKNGKT